MSTRASRTHVRVRTGRTAGADPLLQLDQPNSAAGGVWTREAGHRRDRHDGRGTRTNAGTDHSRHRGAIRVFTRELHADRARLRDRDLRGGHGCDRTRRRRAAVGAESASDGRMLLAKRLRRRHRVVRSDHQTPRSGRAVGAPAQRSRMRRRCRRVRGDGGRRTGGGHAVRQR